MGDARQVSLSDYQEFSQRKGLSTYSTDDIELELNKRKFDPLNFPLDVFHSKVRKYMTEIEREYNLAPSFIGGAFLSSYSSAIGTSYVAGFNQRDMVYLPMWLGLVGISSSGKSSAINFAYSPLKKIQKELAEQYDENIAQVAEENKRTLEVKEFIFRDTQVATLVKDTLRNNPKGVVKVMGELAEWINGLNLMGRGQGTDEEFWISSWNCDPYYKTLSGNKKYYVHRPFANVIGGIQWDILPLLFKGHRATSGFGYRIAFAIDNRDDIALYNPFYELPWELEKPHHTCINHLYYGLKVENHYQEPFRCTASKNAVQLFLNWRNEKHLELKLRPDRHEKNKFAGVLGKIIEYVMRFGALIHLSDKAYSPDYGTLGKGFNHDECIHESEMKRALKLADYFFYSALHCYDTVEDQVNPNLLAMKVSFGIKAGNSHKVIAKTLWGEKYNNDAGRKKLERLIPKLMKDYPHYFGGQKL
ncbi:MAG: DUF3987 domain-containing protein [Bacteroidota bacterium]